MARFVITPLAKADINDIVAFIRRDSRDAAKRVRAKLRRELKRLADFPGIGHLKLEANDDTLRFWSVYSYVIVYRENTNPLEILRVIHGARDIGSAVRRIR
ncbi:MAG: hypothetical protein JWL69_4074 [Phycisphaerales bacterium]|jgi:plasmid stabilization system protein ParE|nr:hypothetical protein [Phycisphaerales bacterium]MDB5353789.1 hypothetical protein [Phycisphaerales bacterium]